MGYAVAVLAFGLWALTKKKLGGGGGFGRGGGGGFKAKLWFIPPILLLIASAAAWNTGLGGWIAGKIAALLGWAGGFVGMSAALIAGVGGLLLLVATVFDLWDKKADGVAKTGLIWLPMLAIIAVGPVAAAGIGFFGEVSNVGTTGLTSLIGG